MSYLSVRHLAHRMGASYFFSDRTDRKFVSGIHKPLLLPKIFVRGKIFRSKDFERHGFLDELRDLVADGYTASIKGALLGETLAQLATHDSRSFASLTVSQCVHHRTKLGSKKLVAAHLRAGDFREWEPEAILPAGYYIAAVESVRGLNSDEWHVRLCVDDYSHPAYEQLSKFLVGKGFSLDSMPCSRPFECDLAAMAQAEILISSPSSFALVAGLLGVPRVIHSEEWVANRVSRGEVFWSRIGEGTFPGYALEGMV